MRTTLCTLSLVLCAATLAHAQPAPQPAGSKQQPPAAKTTVTWYGHAAFKVETPSGKTILIDPWLTNPTNPSGKDDVKNTKADLILVTHGHFDHIGDANDIAKRTRAKLVATFDLGNAIVAAGYPKDQFGMDTGGNFGGTITALDGEVAIKNGPTLYHTGDTDLFGDMAQIGKFAKVDLMLACIGDHFTMGPDRAAEAVKLVKPKQVAGMHYGTFPILNGTPAEFAKAVKKTGAGAKVIELKIGAPITL